MKIYDEGIFFSHLDIEVAKSERFGYHFCVLGITVEDEGNLLLSSILEADFRASDVVARVDENLFYVLLNGVKKEYANKFLERVLDKAVVKNGLSIRTAMFEYQDGDTRRTIIDSIKKGLE